MRSVGTVPTIADSQTTRWSGNFGIRNGAAQKNTKANHIRIVITCSFLLAHPRFLAAPGRVSPRRAPQRVSERALRAHPACCRARVATPRVARAATCERVSAPRERLRSLPSGPCAPWRPAGGGSGCVRLALSWRGRQSGGRPRGGAAGASGVRGIRSSSLWSVGTPGCGARMSVAWKGAAAGCAAAAPPGSVRWPLLQQAGA